MREIKFRVWHPPVTDGEVTLPGHMDYELEHRKYLAVRTETQAIPADFGFEHVKTGSYFINEDLKKYGDRLMQYTGLKDKNGKEIYEGDIVKHIDLDSREEQNMVVSWFEYMGNWRAGETTSLGYLLRKDDIYSIEIIGNIYENKELLT